MAFIQSYIEVADALEGKSISVMNKIARECRKSVNRVTLCLFSLLIHLMESIFRYIKEKSFLVST